MKKLVTWMLIVQSLDALSTCSALRSGKFKESNPLLGNSCKSVAAVKSAITVPIAIVALRKQDSKRMKWIVAISASSASIGFTWNISQMRNK